MNRTKRNFSIKRFSNTIFYDAALLFTIYLLLFSIEQEARRRGVRHDDV